MGVNKYGLLLKINISRVRGLGSSCTIWLSHMFVSVPKANPDLNRHGYALYCLLVLNNLRWEIVDNTLTDVCHAIATETCQKYSVTVIFYYIFHVKPHFLKTLFQSRLLFDFDDFFTNKNRIKCSFTL
jgi:hypothetical protein